MGLAPWAMCEESCAAQGWHCGSRMTQYLEVGYEELVAVLVFQVAHFDLGRENIADLPGGNPGGKNRLHGFK